VHTGFRWNVTTGLDLVCIVGFAAVWWLAHQRDRFGGGDGYATDPMCGMQVERAHPGAVASVGGSAVYFCSDGCRKRFLSSVSSGAYPG
jgi:hypothetical protein